MALEDMTGTDKFPNVFNNTWPANTDPTAQGNEHIYGVKNVIINWASGYEAANLKTQVGDDIDTKVTANNTSYVDPTIDSKIAANNTAYVDPAVASGVALWMPSGSITIWPVDVVPTGWLECDGSSQLTSSYADLFAVLQYSYGGSGGNFNLPDLRAMFVRGLDNGRGVDTGRAIGSFQEQDNAPHTHGVNDPGHTHSSFAQAALQSDFGAGNLTGQGGSTGSALTGISIVSSGSEARPKNVAMKYIIRT